MEEEEKERNGERNSSSAIPSGIFTEYGRTQKGGQLCEEREATAVGCWS